MKSAYDSSTQSSPGARFTLRDEHLLISNNLLLNIVQEINGGSRKTVSTEKLSVRLTFEQEHILKNIIFTDKTTIYQTYEMLLYASKYAFYVL
jgi:hypothetical protein